MKHSQKVQNVWNWKPIIGGEREWNWNHSCRKIGLLFSKTRQNHQATDFKKPINSNHTKKSKPYIDIQW
jgi:hypothetical protein